MHPKRRQSYIVGIEGRKDLVRDTGSMAVVNTDGNALKRAKEEKRRRQAEIQRTQKLETRVGNLEHMLKKVLNILEDK